MNDTQTITEIAAQAASTRYAQLVTIAAGAEEKVAALEGAVKDSEYFRYLAEQQLYAAEWPEGLGQVLHIGTEPPALDVPALIDLYSGQVWVRRTWNGGQTDPTSWIQLNTGTRSNTTYTWPIDSAGPFIKVKDDYLLVGLARDMATLNDWKRKVHDLLRNENGYSEEGKSIWSVVDIPEGLQRVLTARSRKAFEQANEISELKEKLRVAEYELNLYKEADAVKEVTA